MDRYEINKGKRVDPKDDDTVDWGHTILSAESFREPPTESEKVILSDLAENCFVIASKITGSTSPSIPTEDTIKIATQLMHLPEPNAQAIRNRIEKSYGSL